MTYKQALHYLYESTPLFQKTGNAAYKEGLENTYLLDKRLGFPHKNYRTIHVGGTNGKGSVSHILASVLQEAGYKTGLYTSPHLTDFRERIKINGKCIEGDFIAGFVSKHISFFEGISPSFFEVTTAMAFDYFAHCRVDVAIIEVGLGGRLDCTNIILPDLSVITNISLDHTSLLGNSLASIAAEKAGIIKKGIPVIIGEAHPETSPVFETKAAELHAPLFYAENTDPVINARLLPGGHWMYDAGCYPQLEGELSGFAQEKNVSTVLTSIRLLKQRGYRIEPEHVYKGFLKVIQNTGLRGRWQIIRTSPKIILDTGHNEAGIKYNVEQLRTEKFITLHFIIGMVEDKDIDSVLKLLPPDAVYYFTKASVPRALDEKILQQKAHAAGLNGKTFSSVKDALDAAWGAATRGDIIFIGGSTFVVADALATVDI